MKNEMKRKREANFEVEDSTTLKSADKNTKLKRSFNMSANEKVKRLKTEVGTRESKKQSFSSVNPIYSPEVRETNEDFKEWKAAGEKAGQTTLIVDKILSYCSISTLKNARLVSKTWKNSASRLIRHKEKMVVRFYAKSFDYLLSVLDKSDDFPCTHFSFPVEGVKRRQLEKFVQSFGSQIKSVTIRYSKESSDNIMYIQSMIERPSYIDNWDVPNVDVDININEDDDNDNQNGDNNGDGANENQVRVYGVVPKKETLEKIFENIVWFLQQVGNLETLYISNCAWSKFTIENEKFSSISLPRLRNLHFQHIPSLFFPYDLRQTIGYRILKGAPNLHTIENIPLCRAIENEIIEKTPLIKKIQLDLQFITSSLQLRHMMPTFQNFIQKKPAIKILKSTGFFHKEEISPAEKFEFYSLLQSSRKSLEHLELSETISLLDPKFPPLCNLKYLRIREALNSCFLYKYFDQNYLKSHPEGKDLQGKFPHLKTVCIEGSNLAERDNEHEKLPPNFKNSVGSVQCLEFDGATEVYNYKDYGRIFWTPVWLQRLCELFPNVKKITVKNVTPLLLIFFLRDLNRIKWPKLEELEIGSVPRLKGKPRKDHINLDMFFTGLSPDMCRELELESEDKVPGIEKLEELTSGPVFDFSGLKKLHIVFNNAGWYSKHDTFLSKVSLFYGFMRFPDLKVVIHYDQNEDGTGKRRLREKKLKPFAPFVEFSHRPAISDPFY